MPRKPKLVPDWRQWPRMASVQIASVCTVFGLLPVDQQAAILELVGLPAERLPAAMGLAFIAARLWAQPAKK